MANEIDAPAQVETAPGSQAQPTAQPESQAGATSDSIPSASDQLAEAQQELKNFYSDKPAPAPASEKDAAATDATPAGEQVPGEQPAEVKTPPEDEPTPAGELPKQIRPRLSAPEDMAIAGIQRAQNCTFAEAARMYFAATAPAAPAGGDQPSAPAQPSPAQELQAQVDALAGEIAHDRQDDNFLNADHLEKVERLAGLKASLMLAKFQESQQAQAQQQTQAQEAKQARDQSFESARTEFPTVGDPTSPIRQAVDVVMAEWAGDPATAGRLDRVDMPQMLAREAAERVAANLVNTGKFRTLDLALASLKAAPAPAASAAQAPAPVSSPAPAVQPPARRVTPAPGSKGQQQNGQPSTFGEVFASVETADQGNDALRQFYGGPTQGRRRGS